MTRFKMGLSLATGTMNGIMFLFIVSMVINISIVSLKLINIFN